MQPELSGCLDTAINIGAGTSPKLSFKHATSTQMPTYQSKFENLPLNNRWMCPSSIKEHLIKPISAGKQLEMCPGWVFSSAVPLWDPWTLLWGGGKGQGAFAEPLSEVFWSLIYLPWEKEPIKVSVGRGNLEQMLYHRDTEIHLSTESSKKWGRQ